MLPIDPALKELSAHMWLYGERIICCKVMLRQSLTQSWRAFMCTNARKPAKKHQVTMIAQQNQMIGRVIEIIGIAVGDRGRSCEEHVAYCRVVLAPDVLVRLVKEEILVEGRIETVVSAYWVTDSVECCRVGFLPRFMVAKHANAVNGLLAQVTKVFDNHNESAAIREKVYRNFGFCYATILDPEHPLNV
jgi:hypothetical protein